VSSLTADDLQPVMRAKVEVRTEAEVVVPDAVEFARTQLGFEPDEKQEVVLRSDAKRGILNCTRQWGKSTVCFRLHVGLHQSYTDFPDGESQSGTATCTTSSRPTGVRPSSTPNGVA
jgi:hypothetical protein